MRAGRGSSSSRWLSDLVGSVLERVENGSCSVLFRFDVLPTGFLLVRPVGTSNVSASVLSDMGHV